MYPTSVITDPTDGTQITQAPAAQPYQSSMLSYQIYATDNANMSPAGWAWNLSFSTNPPVAGNPAPITFFAPVGPCTFAVTNTPGMVSWSPTAAFSQAFPNIVLPNGTLVQLTTLTGGTGLTQGSNYYVVNSGPHTFELSATLGGSAIATSAVGTGTFTVLRYRYLGLAGVTGASSYSPYMTTAAFNSSAQLGTCQSVLAWGADPTGVNASDAAFAAAVAACAGSVSPLTNTRVAAGYVYMPAGVYKLTQDWVIQSIQGLIVKGDGRGSTKITASGTGFTNAVVYGDGVYNCVFEDFSITGDGTEAAGSSPIPWGMQLTKATATHTVTTQCSVNRITVLSFNWAGGFIAGAPAGTTNQVDGCTIRELYVSGSGNAGFSFASKWLVGIQLGNSSFGNQYNHVLHNCNTSGTQTGTWCNASGFEQYGGQPAQNAVDYLVNPGAQITITGVQSQSSGRFISQTSGGSASFPVSVRDCEFNSGVGNADGKWVNLTTQSRSWEFSNIRTIITNVNPIMAFNGGGNPEVVTLINVAQNNTFTAGVTTNNGGTVAVLNYMQINTSGQLVAVTNQMPGIASSVITYITATGANSYTIPAGCSTLDVTIVGGGAGGGSGAYAASGNVGGGSGGGAGGYSRQIFQASALTSPVTVTVGAGGTGGVAVTTPSAGNAATNNAGSTLFGGYMWAHGGAVGGAGNATNGSAVGGGAGGAGMIIGSAGGPTVTTAAIGGAGVASTTSGGGAGGGVNTNAAFGGGGAAAPFLGANGNSSSGGVVGGASPTNGSAVIQAETAPGGGGGAAALSGAAQQGANGQANTGSGGGGGGASQNGTTSGAGGNGGSGFALIVAHFT
jgi:hypothetical protein